MKEVSVTELLQLTKLVRDLQQRRHDDIEACLAELTTTVVRLVPSAQHAGITLVQRTGQIENLAATGDYPGLLDAIQQRYGEGPCLATAWRHRRVRVDDLSTERRWPHFATMHSS